MLCRIHAVEKVAALHEFLNDANGLLGDSRLGLLGRGADVMRSVNARRFNDWILKLLRLGSWLFLIDVQRSARQLTDSDRFGKRLLIDDAAAAAIDEERGRFIMASSAAPIRCRVCGPPGT